ncbi:MAG: PorT family protein [Cyclobacteriaceae bacterium]|nr:PorT family protein [Cyclobacteriaceae bacterium]MCX7636714.1 PorT family protein [Cyclobacteriaceae bacterium]MDW8331501.1 outer membrane beta-barrel protein [Cyclobacteriaceae bacterium]
MKNIAIHLVIFICTGLVVAKAQKFSYGFNLGYALNMYSFPVETSRFHGQKINAGGSVIVGFHGYRRLTNILRFGTGINYMHVNSDGEAGRYRGFLVNPNSIGTVNYQITTSIFHFPVEMIAFFEKENEWRPFMLAGLNFFYYLKDEKNFFVVPDDYNSGYALVAIKTNENTIDRHFGFHLGLGITRQISDKYEATLRMTYRINTSYYLFIRPRYEEQNIRYTIPELSLLWSFLRG